MGRRYLTGMYCNSILIMAHKGTGSRENGKAKLTEAPEFEVLMTRESILTTST